MATSSALWAAAICKSLSMRRRCSFSSSYSLSCAKGRHHLFHCLRVTATCETGNAASSSFLMVTPFQLGL